MLKLKNITKQFKNRKNTIEVLKGISLEIEKGDMIGIMGPSGSGKSTLLRIIGCMDYPTDGTYLIDGRDVRSLKDKELAYMRSQKFGFVFQDFALIEEESVIENIMVPFFFQKRKLSELENEVEEILKCLHIEHLAGTKVNRLSGGEKQRVAIARALIKRPDVILADEPTGALDFENTIQIMDILKRLNQEGITILMITHDRTAAKYCDVRYDLTNGGLYRTRNRHLTEEMTSE